MAKPHMVMVDQAILREYLSEYHQPRRMISRRMIPDEHPLLCKADGQDWPCDTYKHLRDAAGMEPRIKSSQRCTVCWNFKIDGECRNGPHNV